jgi:hypothetical protein
MQITNFFRKGLAKTIKLANGTQFSYAGPWANVIESQTIDTWFVGDFMSADYTISVDHNTYDKEIIKCLVVAGPDTAAVTIYGRTSLTVPLIDVQVTVNQSRANLVIVPLNGPCKVIFSANYYQSANSIVTN